MSKSNSPRERLIETALRLFYTQGYQATGINQLIREAEVAKASFYDHFSDKEDLCVAFLERRHDLWMASLEKRVAREKSTFAQIIAIFRYLEEWMEKDKYRGCAFLNMTSEFCDSKSKVRKVITWHKDELRNYCEKLIKAHFKEAKLSRSQAKALSNKIYVLVDGAIITSQVYGNPWSIRTARGIAEEILNLKS